MAWIESNQEVGRHPKTNKLARLLGVSRPTVVGHLHYLWWWALDFAQDGILSKYDGDDVAEAMEWEGDSGVLLAAMVESGYLDETENGLMIHDWGDYAGKLMERREKDRARKKKAAEKLRAAYEIRGSSSGTDAESAETLTESLVTVPNSTVPNSTVPIDPEGEEPAAPAAEATPYKAIVDLYHEICISYPKLRQISESRKKAIAARWKEYKHNLETFRELFTRAEASPFLKGKNKRNWTADFNWLMNSENMAKVLEGNYTGERAPAQPTPPSWPTAPDPQPADKWAGGFKMATVDEREEE